MRGRLALWRTHANDGSACSAPTELRGWSGIPLRSCSGKNDSSLSHELACSRRALNAPLCLAHPNPMPYAPPSEPLWREGLDCAVPTPRHWRAAIAHCGWGTGGRGWDANSEYSLFRGWVPDSHCEHPLRCGRTVAQESAASQNLKSAAAPCACYLQMPAATWASPHLCQMPYQRQSQQRRLASLTAPQCFGIVPLLIADLPAPPMRAALRCCYVHVVLRWNSPARTCVHTAHRLHLVCRHAMPQWLRLSASLGPYTD